MAGIFTKETMNNLAGPQRKNGGDGSNIELLSITPLRTSRHEDCVLWLIQVVVVFDAL